MQVIKRNGDIEEFDKNKFIDSLSKSGFSEEEINKAYEKVESELYENIPTDEIYDKTLPVLKELEDIEPIVKYSLKKAVMELGPTGFPFEKLVSRIFEEQGYKTQTGVLLAGKCIDHEVDILAYKDGELIAVEAKFHNDQKTRSDTKVALYVKARFDDMLSEEFEIDGKKRKITRPMLITNTGFTRNSKKYGKCIDIFEMISWTYPKGKGLLKMIEDAKIHPITSIPELSKSEKISLINAGVIYCRDLEKDPSILKVLNASKEKEQQILERSRQICNSY